MKIPPRRTHGFAASGRVGIKSPTQALLEPIFNSGVHGKAKRCRVQIGEIAIGKDSRFGILVADDGVGLPKNREHLMAEVFNEDVDNRNVPRPENGRINNHVGMSAFISYIGAQDAIVLTQEKGGKLRKYIPGIPVADDPYEPSKDEVRLFRTWCGKHGFLLCVRDIVGCPIQDVRKIVSEASEKRYIGFYLGKLFMDFDKRVHRMRLTINELDIDPIDNLARNEVRSHLKARKTVSLVTKKKGKDRILRVQLTEKEQKEYLELRRVIHRLDKKIILPYMNGQPVPARVIINDVPHAGLDPSFCDKYYGFSNGTEGLVVSTVVDGRIVDLHTTEMMFESGAKGGGKELSARVEIELDAVAGQSTIVKDIIRSAAYYSDDCLKVLRENKAIKEALRKIRQRRKKAVDFIKAVIERTTKKVQKKSPIRAAYTRDTLKPSELEIAERSAYDRLLSILEKSKDPSGIQLIAKINEMAVNDALKANVGSEKTFRRIKLEYCRNLGKYAAQSLNTKGDK